MVGNINHTGLSSAVPELRLAQVNWVERPVKQQQKRKENLHRTIGAPLS